MQKKSTEIYTKIINTIGEGVMRHTTITITNKELRITTDEKITAEKIQKLDEVIGKKGFIRPKNNEVITIRYLIPPK